MDCDSMGWRVVTLPLFPVVLSPRSMRRSCAVPHASVAHTGWGSSSSTKNEDVGSCCCLPRFFTRFPTQLCDAGRVTARIGPPGDAMWDGGVIRMGPEDGPGMPGRVAW